LDDTFSLLILFIGKCSKKVHASKLVIATRIQALSVCNVIGYLEQDKVYDIESSKASTELIKLTSEGAASPGRDKAEVTREVGMTWLFAGRSCNNLPDTDYSTFDLFSEGGMMMVTDRPWHLCILERRHGKMGVTNNKSHVEVMWIRCYEGVE